ncbi:MAG: ATP-dependent sacrificial sulfur transferase LarE [Pseudomonadota bacterium]
MSLALKTEKLKRRLQELESAVVAFSGGVDSAVLVVIAAQVLKDKMCAATAVSPSLPTVDKQSALKLCQERNIKHFWFETNEFAKPEFTANSENRCYYCKKTLYECLWQKAEPLGYKFIIEGTNASDLKGHRPGALASRENPHVVTPLIDCEFTKEEVRELAGNLAIEVAQKPASACLSSRIPFGSQLTPDLMKKIDQAEEIVRKYGFTQIRVRDHGNLARLELKSAEFQLALACHQKLVVELQNLGYNFVTLDLKGYRTGGSAG